MINQTPAYRKLPGIKKNLLMGAHRLWAAEDHLLQVHSRVGTEHYQRFYFQDIQSLITRKTASGKIYNLLLAAVTLLLILPALQLEGWASIFFYCMAAVFLGVLLINWLLGPTCRTHLTTAVQQELLPSLHRLKTAMKVMNQLRPRIEAKQGKMTPELLAGRRAQIQQSVKKAAKPPTTQSRSTVHRSAATPARGRIHLILAVLLVARAILGLGEFYLRHTALSFIDMSLFLLLFIAAIVFLVRQYDPPRHSGLMAIAWSTVAYVSLSAISGYAMLIFVAFKEPNAAFNQWKQIGQVARMSPNDNGFLFGLQLFFIIFAAVLGICLFMISGTKSNGMPSRGAVADGGFRSGSNREA